MLSGRILFELIAWPTTYSFKSSLLGFLRRILELSSLLNGHAFSTLVFSSLDEASALLLDMFSFSSVFSI